MIDTKKEEDDGNSLLEYFVASAVVLFFGGLYYYINFGSQVDTGHAVLASSTQGKSQNSTTPSLLAGSASLALTTNSATDKATSDTKSDQNGDDKVEALNVASTPDSGDSETKGVDSAANEQAANDARLHAEAVAELETKKSQLETDVAKLEADREKLIKTNTSLTQQADASAQKIAEAKQVQQAAAVVQAPANAEATQQAKTPDGNVYMLPDGRKIDIADKGFEGMLKQALTEKTVNAPIIFDAIYFDSGAAEPNEQSQNQILATTALMHAHKDMDMLIKGHSDDTGNTKGNTLLSLTRSNYMKNALVKLGIDARRIKVQGVGSLEPIAPNNTAEGRNSNRRIELILLN